jgi:hypothetical protein
MRAIGFGCELANGGSVANASAELNLELVVD